MQLDLMPADWEETWIIGFDESEEESEEEESEEEEEESEEQDEEDDKEKKSSYTQKDVDAIRAVNQKERKLRREMARDKRKLERELADLKLKAETGDDKQRADAAQAMLDSERSKGGKLATRLRDVAVESAIVKVASSRDFKFRDIDDVLAMVSRADIDVDQDDEDPADIEIDEDTVRAAVKKLADKKPHLLVAEGDDEASGRKFGGKKKKTDDLDEDVLRGRYSALARGSSSPGS